MNCPPPHDSRARVSQPDQASLPIRFPSAPQLPPTLQSPAEPSSSTSSDHPPGLSSVAFPVVVHGPPAAPVPPLPPFNFPRPFFPPGVTSESFLQDLGHRCQRFLDERGEDYFTNSFDVMNVIRMSLGEACAGRTTASEGGTRAVAAAAVASVVDPKRKRKKRKRRVVRKKKRKLKKAKGKRKAVIQSSAADSDDESEDQSRSQSLNVGRDSDDEEELRGRGERHPDENHPGNSLKDPILLGDDDSSGSESDLLDEGDDDASDSDDEDVSDEDLGLSRLLEDSEDDEETEEVFVGPNLESYPRKVAFNIRGVKVTVAYNPSEERIKRKGVHGYRVSYANSFFRLNFQSCRNRMNGLDGYSLDAWLVDYTPTINRCLKQYSGNILKDGRILRSFKRVSGSCVAAEFKKIPDLQFGTRSRQYFSDLLKGAGERLFLNEQHDSEVGRKRRSRRRNGKRSDAGPPRKRRRTSKKKTA